MAQIDDGGLALIVKAYRPVLCELLHTTKVIEQMKELIKRYDVTENNQPVTSATTTPLVEQFLDVLLEEEEDKQGLFKGFMDVLSSSDLGILRKHIDATVGLEEEARERYRQFFLSIYANNLSMIPTLEVLESVKSCLAEADIEGIWDKVKHKGNGAGAAELLIRLPHDYERYFTLLIKGLKESMTRDLADQLEEGQMFIKDQLDKNRQASDEQPDVEDIDLRPYQEEVVAPALRGENTMIVVPTGCGKTVIAIAVMRRLFDSAPDTAHTGGSIETKRSKVVFIVNTIPLVRQHKTSCQRFLGKGRTIAGVSSQEMNDSPLAGIINDHDVTIVTAQKLVDELEINQSFTLSDIDLLIIDECHHCHKSKGKTKHSYNVLMAKYRDMKLDEPEKRRPQVLALTASPGVGNSKYKVKAVEYIIKLCANLDCTISTVVKHQADLDKHYNAAKENLMVVPGRGPDDPFILQVTEVMKDITQIMKASEDGGALLTTDNERPSVRERYGAIEYDQWLVTLMTKIRLRNMDKDQFRMLLTCCKFLRACNNSLYVNRDARTSDAVADLEDFVKDQENTSVPTVIELVQKCREKILSQHVRMRFKSSNPVLRKFEEILEEEYKKNPDSRCIIFTRTRFGVKTLLSWLNEELGLKKLKIKADKLIGHGHQGMTAHAQYELLWKFKNKDCNIVVATSVGEEGLDIQACNMVVRYNYVTSEIGHVQTKGRSRAEGGKVYVILNESLQMYSREKKNTTKVALMKEAVRAIVNMDQSKLKEQILEGQIKDRNERRDENATPEKPEKSKDSYELLCKGCKELICRSEDVRVVRKCHHFIRNCNISDKFNVEKSQGRNKGVSNGVEFHTKIYCKGEDGIGCGQKLGSLGRFNGRDLVIVAIKNLLIQSPDGEELVEKKKWKDVPFEIQEADDSDIGMVPPSNAGNHNAEIAASSTQIEPKNASDDTIDGGYSPTSNDLQHKESNEACTAGNRKRKAEDDDKSSIREDGEPVAKGSKIDTKSDDRESQQDVDKCKESPNTGSSQQGLSDLLLYELSEKINVDKMLHLGIRLGVPYRTITTYEKESVAGMREMLFNWRDSESSPEQRSKLKEALCKVGLAGVAEEFLPEQNDT